MDIDRSIAADLNINTAALNMNAIFIYANTSVVSLYISTTVSVSFNRSISAFVSAIYINASKPYPIFQFEDSRPGSAGK